MRDKDKDRDPVKARKRATSDLRCAARKLGYHDAIATLEELFGVELVAKGTEGRKEKRA